MSIVPDVPVIDPPSCLVNHSTSFSTLPFSMAILLILLVSLTRLRTSNLTRQKLSAFSTEMGTVNVEQRARLTMDKRYQKDISPGLQDVNTHSSIHLMLGVLVDPLIGLSDSTPFTSRCTIAFILTNVFHSAGWI